MRRTPSTRLIGLWLIACLGGINAIRAGEAKNLDPPSPVAAVLDIARVPADLAVSFCLLTHGARQYVAYYDAGRRMTVACRTLDSAKWQYQALPSKVGWDSHNYVTMAVDDDGALHLAGNMHVNPLIYFRTTKAWDIRTFRRIPAMTGMNEACCTYPHFMRGADGSLVFHYRDGSSGDGNEIFNVYDFGTRTWRRLLDKPLTDGMGKMNAYMDGPSRGPDGWFHLAWVWRDTPDCSTNHDPSYARSRDLVHWESIDGTPLALPITPDTKGTLVDAVPAHGGIINGCQHVGFDNAQRVVVSYHKFDEAGNTQAYVARFEGGRWVIRRISDWGYRWDFKGGGSLPRGDVQVGAVRSDGEGKLKLPCQHIKYGGQTFVLDEQTLRVVGIRAASMASYPKALCKTESKFDGMQVRWSQDSGEHRDKRSRFVLRWETLPPNRDSPRQGPLPEPSMLRLYQLRNPIERTASPPPTESTDDACR